MYALSKLKVDQTDINNINDAYSALFAAIWARAVEDDYLEQKAKLFYELTESKYDKLLFREKPSRDTFSKIKAILTRNVDDISARQITNEIKELEKVYDSALPLLKRIVQCAVWREAQAYPKRHYKDKQYPKDYKALKEQILSQL